MASKKPMRPAVGYLLLVLVVLASILVLGLLVRAGWLPLSGLSSLSAEVATAIIAGSVTVVVSVGSLILSRHFERRQQIEQQMRDRKIPIYEEFMAFWFRVLFSTKIGKKVSEQEILEFAAQWTQKLIVWGSDEFLKEYVTWKNQYAGVTDSSQVDSRQAIRSFEKLLWAIRTDLGHPNDGLAEGDLIRLFVTDWHLPDG